jgi:hypothetical protein
VSTEVNADISGLLAVFQPGKVRTALLTRLVRSLGKSPARATARDIYDALSLAVHEELSARWVATQARVAESGAKRVCYLSMEYLPGRSLPNAVASLGQNLEEETRTVLAGLGFNYEEIVRLEPDPGDNIGILLEDTHTGRKTFYAPGLGVIEPHIATAMAGADCVLVDGTFWTEDEMVRSGLSSKLAHEMGHLPLSGDAGMLAFLNTLDARRKIVIHINNSNPILDDDSAERAELTRYGVEVAYDGMEIEL